MIRRLRVERLQRREHERSGQLDLAEQVRGPMLQGLERADLDSELLTLAQIGQRTLEGFIGHTQELGCKNGSPRIERRIEHEGSLIELADDIRFRHSDVVQLHDRDVAAVHARVTMDRHSVRFRVDQEQ